MTNEMKSAIELAMEKLDREMGESLPKLSDEQKQEIASIRAKYQSKIAQEEISLQSAIRDAYRRGDRSEVAQLEQNLLSERQRFERQMEKEIAEIRKRHE